MHCVLLKVVVSLAPDDSYQEMELDPLVKNANLNEKAVHYKKTYL